MTCLLNKTASIFAFWKSFAKVAPYVKFSYIKAWRQVFLNEKTHWYVCDLVMCDNAFFNFLQIKLINFNKSLFFVLILMSSTLLQMPIYFWRISYIKIPRKIKYCSLSVWRTLNRIITNHYVEYVKNLKAIILDCQIPN